MIWVFKIDIVDGKSGHVTVKYTQHFPIWRAAHKKRLRTCIAACALHAVHKEIFGFIQYNGILNFVGELCQIILSYVKFYTESENDIYIFHICDILAIIVVLGHKSYFWGKNMIFIRNVGCRTISKPAKSCNSTFDGKYC